MDLSILKSDTFAWERRGSEAEIRLEGSEIPWRPNEVEFFNNFLLSSMERFRRENLGNSHSSDTQVFDSRNLCVIRGQTGSGKATTVRRMCTNLGIKLVEYDPFNTVLNTGREFDHNIDHLIRFLQNSLSRKSLKKTATPSTPATSTQNLLLGRRRVKRIKATSTPESNPRSDSPNPSHGMEHSQVVLVCDLPRGILNCKYTNLHPLQKLMREVVSSETYYPLVLLTTNSTEDYQILRRILPPNYLRDPRCLVINLKEIKKAKVLSILNLKKKDKMLDHIIDISSGDIRYIMNNMAFYSRHSRDQTEGREIKDHLLGRNNSNTFYHLGKILFNKRIPPCFRIGNSLLKCHNEQETPKNFDISDEFDAIRDLMDIEEAGTRFKECFRLSRPFRNKDCYVDCEDSCCQDTFCVFYDKMPTKVRIYGLTNEFDPNNPTGYTKWPQLAPDPESEHFRHTSDRMLPKVTRPLLYFSPEELIDSITTEPNFFLNSIFDNYSDLFGHIDDCASMTRHFTSADVISTSYRQMYDPSITSQFMSICIRGALDSNIHGFNSQRTGFHSFITHSNVKTKSEHIRSLYQDFKGELSMYNSPTTCSQEQLFLEIIPILSMVTDSQMEKAYEEESTETLGTQETNDEYNIVDVMEQVEKMLEREKGPERKKVKTLKEVSIFTTKFNEILEELSKHYDSEGRGRQESI